jgi:hypothetical protein
MVATIQCPTKKSPDCKKMDAVLERSAAAVLRVVLITAFYEKGQEYADQQREAMKQTRLAARDI